MSSIRKLKRKELAPKMKQAKKYLTDYKERERVAHNATLTQANNINHQACAVINTCAFKVLKDVFKMTSKKLCFLSNNVGFQANCITSNYLTYDNILDQLPIETGWQFPMRMVEQTKPRTEMTASEMADYDIEKLYNEAMAKMELLYLWTLRIREGFSKVRLDRFLKAVRETEKTLTVEQAEQVNDWLDKHGIEFDGFNKEVFTRVKYFGGEA